MAELNILKYAYLMLRVRLAAIRDDERGISTLESVLLVAGFATIALLAIAFITTKVNDAGNNIPTGPAGP
jgi:hypothetical protein